MASWSAAGNPIADPALDLPRRMKRPLRIASASNAMDLQEEPGASFPDRRGLGPAMRRDSRMLMQRPEALLNHLSRSHFRRRVLGSERTLNERPRPVANLLAGAFVWRLSTAFE